MIEYHYLINHVGTSGKPDKTVSVREEEDLAGRMTFSGKVKKLIAVLKTEKMAHPETAREGDEQIAVLTKIMNMTTGHVEVTNKYGRVKYRVVADAYKGFFFIAKDKDEYMSIRAYNVGTATGPSYEEETLEGAPAIDQMSFRLMIAMCDDAMAALESE